MAGDRWYVNSAHAAINWGTAVSGGVATTDIYEVTLDPTTGTVPLYSLWRRAGRAVSAGQVTAAQAATSGDAQPTDPPTSPTFGPDDDGQMVFPFSVARPLAVFPSNGSNDIPLLNGFGYDLDIIDIAAAVAVAPTGAALQVDLLVDGASVFTSAGHRLTIPDGQTESTSVTIDNPTWPDGAQLVLRITQVGSTIAGARLGGYVLARRAA